MSNFGITKRLFGILTLIVLSGCSFYNGPKPGEAVPRSIIALANGQDVLLSSYQGKTVAIMFWASWCKFSEGGMEDFNEVAAKYKGREDIVFIAISIDESRDVFERTIREREYNNVKHAFSGNGPYDEMYIRFGQPAIPLAVKIGPDGVVQSYGSRIDL